MEPYQTSFTSASIYFNVVDGCFCFIHQIRIKDIKLVALHNLGRRVVMIVMCLIIFVPLISGMDTIEIFRFSWTILIMPPIHLQREKIRDVNGIS